MERRDEMYYDEEVGTVSGRPTAEARLVRPLSSTAHQWARGRVRRLIVVTYMERRDEMYYDEEVGAVSGLPTANRSSNVF